MATLLERETETTEQAALRVQQQHPQAAQLSDEELLDKQLNRWKSEGGALLPTD